MAQILWLLCARVPVPASSVVITGRCMGVYSSEARAREAMEHYTREHPPVGGAELFVSPYRLDGDCWRDPKWLNSL